MDAQRSTKDVPAPPSPPAVQLLWLSPAPAECPSNESLLQELAELLPPEDPATPRRLEALQAELRLTRERRGYRLVVRLPEGTRVFTGESCADVHRAGALLLALVLARGEEAPAPPEQSASSPEEATLSESKALPPREPPPVREDPLRTSLGVLGGVDRGTLPRPVPLALLTAAVHLELWQLGLQLGTTATDHRTTDAVRSVSLHPMWAGVSACRSLLVPLQRWAFGPCGGVDFGVLRARSEGTVEPVAGTSAMLHGSLGALLSYTPTRRWSVVAQGQWAYPLLVPSVWLEGPGPRVEAHRVGPALRLGLGLRLDISG